MSREADREFLLNKREVFYMKKQRGLILKILLLFVLFNVCIAFKPSTVHAYSQSQTFNANGKTFTVVLSSNNGVTTLYQKVSGHYKQVARTSKCIGRYCFSYGKKIYFTIGGTNCFTYTYTIGKKGFKFEKNIYLIDHRGKYAIGYLDHMIDDLMPYAMCCYNLSTRKVTKLGGGCDLHFIGNKIYYAYACDRYSTLQTTMQVIRRNADGSGKKVIKTIRIKQGTNYMYVLSIHKVKYHIGNYKWKIIKI